MRSLLKLFHREYLKYSGFIPKTQIFFQTMRLYARNRILFVIVCFAVNLILKLIDFYYLRTSE